MVLVSPQNMATVLRDIKLNFRPFICTNGLVALSQDANISCHILKFCGFLLFLYTIVSLEVIL